VQKNIYFKGIYEEEKKDLLGIQRYFDPENYVLDLDLLQSIEKSKKLIFPGVSKALEDVINHYEKISEIVEKILDVKEEVGELLKNVIENEFIQDHVEKFLNLVVELVEGPKIVAQLTDCKVEELKIGLEVEAVFRKKYEDNQVIRYGIKFRPIRKRRIRKGS